MLFISPLKLIMLKWESVRIDSLLKPASSGSLKNCRLQHFYVVCMEAATQLRPSFNSIKIVFLDLEKNFQPYTKIV